MTGTFTSRAARCAASLLLAAAGAVALGGTPAQAADGVARYSVQAAVDTDGSLAVRATLGLEGAPGQVQQRFATTLDSGRDVRYRFTLSDVSASVGGQPVAATVTAEGDYQVVTVPLPAGGSGPVGLSYRVRGAAFRTDDDTTTVNWRLLQGLNLPVRSFDAVVTTPGLFKSVDCYAGPPASPGPCGSYAGGTHDDPYPVFSDGPRGQGEVVGAIVRFDSRVVAADEVRQRVWTLDHAFSAAPLPLGLAAQHRKACQRGRPLGCARGHGLPEHAETRRQRHQHQAQQAEGGESDEQPRDDHGGREDDPAEARPAPPRPVGRSREPALAHDLVVELHLDRGQGLGEGRATRASPPGRRPRRAGRRPRC